MLYESLAIALLVRHQHIFDSVEASLERLQLDHIDVLQCMLWEHPLHARPAKIFGKAIGLTTTRRLKRRYVFYTDPSALVRRPNSPAQMQALHDLVQAGYVHYIGMSSCYAYQCQYLFLSCTYALLTMSHTQSTKY